MIFFFCFGILASASDVARFETVALFTPSTADPGYQEFNEKVSEYFFKNFGQPGTDYLKYVAAIRTGPVTAGQTRSHQHNSRTLQDFIAEQCSEDVRLAMENERIRITAGFNGPQYLKPLTWQRERKTVDQPRYSVHRFVGILEHLSSFGKSPVDAANVSFLAAFKDPTTRQGLTQALDTFKKSIGSMPPMMIKNALILIGNPSQSYRRALRFVNMLSAAYNSNERDSNLRQLLQNLVQMMATNPDAWTVETGISRLHLLFDQGGYLYHRMVSWREALAVKAETCEGARNLLPTVDLIIGKILQIILQVDSSADFDKHIEFNIFTNCEYVPSKGLYPALQSMNCDLSTNDRSTCDLVAKLEPRFKALLNE